MVALTHAGPPQARPGTALSENIPRQANGDLHRPVTPDGSLVRRALGADPRTGQRGWPPRFPLLPNWRF